MKIEDLNLKGHCVRCGAKFDNLATEPYTKCPLCGGDIALNADSLKPLVRELVSSGMPKDLATIEAALRAKAAIESAASWDWKPGKQFDSPMGNETQMKDASGSGYFLSDTEKICPGCGQRPKTTARGYCSKCYTPLIALSDIGKRPPSDSELNEANQDSEFVNRLRQLTLDQKTSFERAQVIALSEFRLRKLDDAAAGGTDKDVTTAPVDATVPECPECGKVARDSSAHFCTRCGTPLKKTPQMIADDARSINNDQETNDAIDAKYLDKVRKQNPELQEHEQIAKAYTMAEKDPRYIQGR